MPPYCGRAASVAAAKTINTETTELTEILQYKNLCGFCELRV